DGAGNVLLEAATTFATLTIGGTATVTNAAVLDQTGPVTLGDNTGAAATLVNQKTYNLDNHNGIAAGTGAGSALLTTGTLAKTGGAGVSHVAVKVTSTGSISVHTGTLSFDGGGTFGGSAKGAGTLVFGGGTATLGSGFSVTVANLALSGGAAVNLGGNVSYAG